MAPARGERNASTPQVMPATNARAVMPRVAAKNIANQTAQLAPVTAPRIQSPAPSRLQAKSPVKIEVLQPLLSSYDPVETSLLVD